jgi:hypothetical protein
LIEHAHSATSNTPPSATLRLYQSPAFVDHRSIRGSTPRATSRATDRRAPRHNPNELFDGLPRRAARPSSILCHTATWVRVHGGVAREA